MDELTKQSRLQINPVTGQIDANESVDEETVFEENGTFCKVGSTAGGIIEIDLRSVKQKGTEERYVSVKTIGYNDNNEISSSEVLILSEQQFNKLKQFMSKLNWND